MSCTFTRREMLRRGLAVAGLAATGTGGRVLAAPAGEKPKAAPSLPVAIGRCTSYEPQVVMARLNEALDLIGGIGPLVRGKTVTIKLNLTGGPSPLKGLPAHRTYHVHPNFVAAACAAMHAAGAKEIVLVEGSYDKRPLQETMGASGWNIALIESSGGHKVRWEDTRHKGPWPGYSRLTVPWGGYVYPAFELNQRYEKTDVFVSLSKLKDHAAAGVTMSMKNLFGIAPTSIYGDTYDGAKNPAVNEESLTARIDTFHKGLRMPPAGAPQEIDPKSPRHWSRRVPRITADLCGVRPVDLALVDGIETNRGGEGPWLREVQPLKPDLLFAGRNGVCLDAICTATLGYDPAAAPGEFPFMGDNYLALLAAQGVGTNVVSEIEVRGLPLAKAVFPFNPTRVMATDPAFQ
ncbi:MAG: DUF362 domain-containing protein [Pirellulales bacterium]